MTISRREFLDKLSLATLGILTGGLAGKLVRIGFEVKPYDVPTKEGNFILLVGTHGVGLAGQTIREPTRSEGSGVDAAFLETGKFKYFKTGTREYEFPEGLDEIAFYKEIIPSLKKGGVKLLFGDVPFKENMNLVANVGPSIIDAVAAFGGPAVALREGKMSRRQFLERSVSGALGLWGIAKYTKDASEVAPELLRKPLVMELRKAALLTEISHPEDALVLLRNALIAEKLLNYASQYGSEGRKPNIAVLMGSGHEFISEYLKKGSEFCRGILNIYPESALRALYGENFLTYFPSLVEVSSIGDKTIPKLIVDESLERMARNKEGAATVGHSELKG